MNDLITIGLPSKGRLKEKSLSFFFYSGLKIVQSEKERNYFGTIENNSNVKIIFLHAKEIIQRLGDGTLDIGISGLDLLKESDKNLQDKINIQLVKFQKFVFLEDRAEYVPINQVPKNSSIVEISGTELRRRLDKDLIIPEWFSFPEVIKELKKAKPPLHKKGFTIFFTGLSGSGKSTIANALINMLLEMGDRSVTLLDGDIVRKRLSSELGFSKEDRDLNIRRIGFVAMEIVKNGGIAICAPIAPYQKTRDDVREEIEAFGSFIEVYLSTPLEICEKRDRKGLYKLAREGKIKEFTGISDPYEVPKNPELILNSEDKNVEYCASLIILKLKSLGLIFG